MQCFNATRKNLGGDVAQLVERRTGTPLTRVRFRGAAKEWFSQSQLSVADRLSCGVRIHVCAIVCINDCAHVNKDPVVHVKSSVDYGNTKTPSKHRRLGSATLSQLAFPRESNPDFPRAKSQWDIQL